VASKYLPGNENTQGISMANMGKRSSTVATNYESGYNLKVLREHMERVW